MKKMVLLSGIIILMILSGCSLPDEPGLPTWTTNLKFYFLHDNYDLLELAEEDSALVVTETAPGDSVLGIYQEEENDQAIDIGSTESIQEEEAAEVGDIELSDVDNIDGVLYFGEFASAAGLSLAPQGTEVPQIDSFSFGSVVQELNPISEIEYVKFMQGGFTINLTNNMIIGLGDHANGDPFRLRLVHIEGTDTLDVIDEIIVEDRNLAPGDSYSTYRDLSGITLYQDMKLLLQGGSLGSSGQPVIIDTLSEFVTEIEFDDNMTAEEASALIAEQTISDTIEVEFDENYKLYYAELSSESSYLLTVDIMNGIDLDLDLEIQIPSVFLNGSQSYTNSFTIPRSSQGGSYHLQEELAGGILGNDTDLLESIVIYAQAHVDSTTGNDYRQVIFTDSYDITATIDELEFEYMRGILGAQQQDTISEEINIDVSYPEIQEGGQFSFVGESELRLNVSTGSSQIPGILVINAQAYDQNDEMVQLVTIPDGNIPEVIIPAENEFTLSFSSSEYNINELLSILPTRIEFTVDVEVGNGSDEVIFQNGDHLMTSIELEAELALAAEAWLIPTEDGEPLISEEEIELEEEELDAFRSARIILEYINTSELNVSGSILLSDSEAGIESELYHFVNPDTSLVDVIAIPQLMTTTGTETDTLEIEISHDDLDYLLSETTFIASRLRLQSEGNQPLSGRVELIGKAEIEVEISNDLVEDEEE